MNLARVMCSSAPLEERGDTIPLQIAIARPRGAQGPRPRARRAIYRLRPFHSTKKSTQAEKLELLNSKMADTTSSTALTMKLLVDANPQRQRVLFAEVGKDVVDFFFSLLALPIGTTVKLLGKESMVGCFGNLYASVEKLDDAYVQSGAVKDVILWPTISTGASANSSIFRLPAPPSGQSKSLFKCPRSFYDSWCNNYVTDASGTSCPNCGRQMADALRFASGQQEQNPAAGGAKGFVTRIATYTMTDDLTITPMSVISSITLLNTYARRGGVLQEKTVQLGYKEGVEILKASLQSKTVLTDVFLGIKPPMDVGGYEW